MPIGDLTDRNIELRTFIGKYIPKGWVEPIRAVYFIPYIKLRSKEQPWYIQEAVKAFDEIDAEKRRELI